MGCGLGYTWHESIETAKSKPSIIYVFIYIVCYIVDKWKNLGVSKLEGVRKQEIGQAPRHEQEVGTGNHDDGFIEGAATHIRMRRFQNGVW